MLCFPTVTEDLKPIYHSRGKIFLPVLGLTATAYILNICSIFFSLSMEVFLCEDDYMFVYFLVLCLCYFGVEVGGGRLVFPVKSQTILTRNPDLYFRKLSLE